MNLQSAPLLKAAAKSRLRSKQERGKVHDRKSREAKRPLSGVDRDPGVSLGSRGG